MIVLRAYNPDQALMLGFRLLKDNHIEGDSRNGRVWRAPEPVTTEWSADRSIVSLSSARNANPFFHLMEALWMLAGRRDLAFVSEYASQMVQYSDDGGVTQPGAYGYRWRKWFETDQLLAAIDELRADPSSRRVVLAMWDGGHDLRAARDGSKDVPCNTHLYLEVVGAELRMTVCCRSNDMVWGAYGSNIVHFSILQEFVACALGLKMGRLWQISNNFHAYIEREDVERMMISTSAASVRTEMSSERLFSGELEGAGDFLRVLDKHLNALYENTDVSVPFLDRVAGPMQAAWRLHKTGQTEKAIEHLGTTSVDWFVAGRAWLQRALERKRAKEQQA